MDMHKMEVNECHQMPSYKHSSKYLVLCPTEKTHTGLKQIEGQ